jgi:hypothetical protein
MISENRQGSFRFILSLRRKKIDGFNPSFRKKAQPRAVTPVKESSSYRRRSWWYGGLLCVEGWMSTGARLTHPTPCARQALIANVASPFQKDHCKARVKKDTFRLNPFLSVALREYSLPFVGRLFPVSSEPWSLD